MYEYKLAHDFKNLIFELSAWCGIYGIIDTTLVTFIDNDYYRILAYFIVLFMSVFLLYKENNGLVKK